MKNLNVRLDDELHARLKEAAENANRSLNGEIITLLTRALNDHDRWVSSQIFREQP